VFGKKTLPKRRSSTNLMYQRICRSYVSPVMSGCNISKCCLIAVKAMRLDPEAAVSSCVLKLVNCCSKSKYWARDIDIIYWGGATGSPSTDSPYKTSTSCSVMVATPMDKWKVCVFAQVKVKFWRLTKKLRHGPGPSCEAQLWLTQTCEIHVKETNLTYQKWYLLMMIEKVAYWIRRKTPYTKRTRFRKRIELEYEIN